MLGYQHITLQDPHESQFMIMAPPYTVLDALEKDRVGPGEHGISLYKFNTGTARHYFCSKCGVESFYVPRSHPHGVSVNARCITINDGCDIQRKGEFDGRNWEKNIASIDP